MIEIPLAFAFGAGLAAAFNPCGAAMLPAYVGYQLGGGEKDADPLRSMFRALLLGLSATAGFVFLSAVVGLILAAGGRAIGQFLPFAGLGVGVAIAALGLWLLLSRRHIGLMFASRVTGGQGRGLRNVFLFGIAYATASLSCALPIFLAAIGIVVGQLATTSMISTVLALISYGLGMGVIIISITLGVVFFKTAVQRVLKFIIPYVDPVGNLAMTGAGGYLIWYWTFGKGSELLFLRAANLF